ncbi:MAG TPA: 3-isopropylmalate dehydrogenase [Vicinamibacterales bacterium]|nr:3-isopropylmalate dehydrogenase [Vicinamibacterales bacterium]
MADTIVLLPGDGIGPEVTEAAARVLEAVAAKSGRALRFESHPIGGAALKAGQPALPPATLEACRRASAVLLGAVGDPAFDHLPSSERPEGGLLALRRGLGVYANLRPARLWPGFEDLGPLKPEVARGADLLIVRELTGGLYFGQPRAIDREAGEAFNTMRYTSGEIERIARVAFDAARRRRRSVTSVDKANVLETSQLWRSVVARVAQDYPDVALQHMYVDACAMMLVTSPSRFDVILTENLFGDILSDEAAVIPGSIGLLPSASLGDGPGLYEPVHGSAPDIAGQDKANPIGAIASASLLLRHSLNAAAEADRIDAAVQRALESGARTADLPGTSPALGCRGMTEAILRAL